jgi:branched-subunit amino acid aminotransferase/4-amino-4-deoxychorismate lyase
MIRTFHHQSFRLDEHLRRLQMSMDAAKLRLDRSLDELAGLGERVLASHAALVGPETELGLIYFVTAGLNPTYVGPLPVRSPTLGIHTFELSRRLWGRRFRDGCRLAVPTVRAMPADVLSPRIKYRSRLHWHIADSEAREIDAGASALLLNERGEITETAAGNFCAVLHGEIVTPPSTEVLNGISLKVLEELAGRAGIPFREAPLRPETIIADASECLLTSTPVCLLPVTHLNGIAIGTGRPGPIFARLLRDWSESVGLDIAASLTDPSDE